MIYDEPDFNRKIHKSNVPLTGGIMIVLNILILSFLIFSKSSDINFYSFFSNYFDFAVFIISTLVQESRIPLNRELQLKEESLPTLILY